MLPLSDGEIDLIDLVCAFEHISVSFNVIIRASKNILLSGSINSDAKIFLRDLTFRLRMISPS